MDEYTGEVPWLLPAVDCVWVYRSYMCTTYMDVLLGFLTGVVKHWRKRKYRLHYRT